MALGVHRSGDERSYKNDSRANDIAYSCDWVRSAILVSRRRRGEKSITHYIAWSYAVLWPLEKCHRCPRTSVLPMCMHYPPAGGWAEGQDGDIAPPPPTSREPPPRSPTIAHAPPPHPSPLRASHRCAHHPTPRTTIFSPHHISLTASYWTFRTISSAEEVGTPLCGDLYAPVRLRSHELLRPGGKRRD
jgi:hypothetical protein